MAVVESIKLCKKCGEKRPLVDFYLDKGKPSSPCKFCRKALMRAWANTPEGSRKKREADARRDLAAKRQKDKEYKQENRAKYLASLKEWRANNKPKCKELHANWRLKNKAKLAMWRDERRLRFRMAMPKWADESAMRSIYEAATSSGLTVDHIVPLKSNLVCGLHVESNLQAMTREQNASKGNRRWPDMP